MIKIFKILFFLVAVFATFLNYSLAKEVVIKDLLNREVKINLPAKRIVIGFYYTDFLAVGGAKAFDNVVGFVKDAWAVYMPPSYERYSKIIPRLKDLGDVGDPQFGHFSLEKLISLKPDLVILADWQYEILKTELEKLQNLNIPVVVISYNQETLAQHTLSTQILGKLLNQEKRAEEIIAFYSSRLKAVQEKIAKAKLKKPRIYIEFGNKGPNELSFTFGKDMWGSLALLAGGDNIAAPFVDKWAVMNKEQVIASNPEVIIITGRETELKKNAEAMVMGIGIEKNEALKRLEGFKKRKGFENLDAVKNKRFYALYHRASTTMSDIASVEFIAKMLYPSLFKELDPIKTYEDFHKQFMPLMPEGTYILGGQ
ncbi:iron ABC transporter substrate-binding protein [Campylobacter sp. MIT 99-7217]|uniref:ABC transporter substrate-binding protein n=1 Tax=Campylobacter sp. MIT 99-7217 TaxID=535091 RepID=UPI00115A1808|nr:ABC transporter substrate-binding protein [Campylobacter sp. MIT 99-7217]TQR30970.1 iron ABC transporter substrate-binding protein [Campylobacter sp. MIT 99-7217]